MTESLTRAVPTPGDVAAGRRPARAAAAPAVPEFDRRRWEQMVLASGLHRNTRLVAFVLAHHASARGHLASGGVQLPSRLAHLARITPKQARLALQQLENWHYIWRPDIRDWPPSSPVRPVTLTMPPKPAPEPSTGEVPK